MGAWALCLGFYSLINITWVNHMVMLDFIVYHSQSKIILIPHYIMCIAHAKSMHRLIPFFFICQCSVCRCTDVLPVSALFYIITVNFSPKLSFFVLRNPKPMVTLEKELNSVIGTAEFSNTCVMVLLKSSSCIKTCN